MIEPGLLRWQSFNEEPEPWHSREVLHQCLPHDKLLCFQYKDEMGNAAWVKIVVYYENDAGRIHKMCEGNAEICNINVGGSHSNCVSEG
jgi:hypothetical protein